jgi:hypothetical protein
MAKPNIRTSALSGRCIEDRLRPRSAARPGPARQVLRRCLKLVLRHPELITLDGQLFDLGQRRDRDPHANPLLAVARQPASQPGRLGLRDARARWPRSPKRAQRGMRGRRVVCRTGRGSRTRRRSSRAATEYDGKQKSRAAGIALKTRRSSCLMGDMTRIVSVWAVGSTS